MRNLIILLVILTGCGPADVKKGAAVGPTLPVSKVVSDTQPAALVIKVETDLDGKELSARQEVRTLTAAQERLWNVGNVRGFAEAQVVQLQSLRGRNDKQCLHAKCYGLYLDDVKAKVAATSTDAKYYYEFANGCLVYKYHSVKSGFGYKYFLFGKSEFLPTCI